MSHFSVAVITQNGTEEEIDAALMPFHEFECTGEDNEYVKNVEEIDKVRAEYEKHTTRMYRDPDGNFHDDDQGREMGYGLSPWICDNEYNLCIVDMENQRVRFDEYKAYVHGYRYQFAEQPSDGYSFEEYIKLDDDAIFALMGVELDEEE